MLFASSVTPLSISGYAVFTEFLRGNLSFCAVIHVSSAGEEARRSLSSFHNITLRTSTGERMERNLRDAVCDGDSAAVARLISLGAKIDSIVGDQDTALIIAAREGHSEVAKQLLQARAQVDLTDRNGDTALINAARYGNSAMVQQLLDAGAKVDHANQYGSTALIAAATYGKSSIVKQLLKAKAKVDHTRNDGKTALMLAASNRDHEVVTQLLANGANVKLKDNTGSTACMLAIQNEDKEIATWLSTAGADPKKTNNAGGCAVSLHSDSIQVGTKRHLTDTQPRPSMVRVQSDCSEAIPNKPAIVLSSRINNEKDAIVAVNGHNGVDLAATKAEKEELRLRFEILSNEDTVSAQEAIAELKYTLERYLKHRVEAEDVLNAVIKHMNGKGRMSLEAFRSSFSDVKKKYPVNPITRVRRVPPELLERFQSATAGFQLLKRIAKPVLCALFQDSGGERSYWSDVSFRRTQKEWDETEVDRLLTEHGVNDTLIDEEGFIEVGMKILFGDRSAAS